MIIIKCKICGIVVERGGGHGDNYNRVEHLFIDEYLFRPSPSTPWKWWDRV